MTEKLRDALAFYADDANWRQNGPLDPNSANFTGGPARAALAAMDTPKGCGDGWQPIETCVSGDGPVLIYNPDMESDPEWPSHAVHVSNRDYVTSGNAKKEGFTAWHPVPPAPPAAMKDGGTTRLEAQRAHDARRRE